FFPCGVSVFATGRESPVGREAPPRPDWKARFDRRFPGSRLRYRRNPRGKTPSEKIPPAPEKGMEPLRTVAEGRESAEESSSAPMGARERREGEGKEEGK